MVEQRLVTAGGAEFWVEVVEGGGGPTTIRDGELLPLSFDGVRDAVEGLASEFAGVWARVKPTEASVELALKVTAKTGKLAALLVEGGGEATLTVKVTWRQPPAPAAGA